MATFRAGTVKNDWMYVERGKRRLLCSMPTASGVLTRCAEYTCRNDQEQTRPRV